MKIKEEKCKGPIGEREIKEKKFKWPLGDREKLKGKNVSDQYEIEK